MKDVIAVRGLGKRLMKGFRALQGLETYAGVVKKQPRVRSSDDSRGNASQVLSG